jgi:hypothetical protein
MTDRSQHVSRPSDELPPVRVERPARLVDIGSYGVIKVIDYMGNTQLNIYTLANGLVISLDPQQRQALIEALA